VIAATGSFNSARGIGLQASVGKAVDEERRAGKTLLAKLVFAQSEQFPASVLLGCGARKWYCVICILKGLI